MLILNFLNTFSKYTYYFNKKMFLASILLILYNFYFNKKLFYFCSKKISLNFNYKINNNLSCSFNIFK